MKKLVFLAIVAMIMVLPISATLANPDYQVRATGESYPSDDVEKKPDYQVRATGERYPSETVKTNWFGGFSLEGGYGTETRGSISGAKATIYPEGFARLNINYLLLPTYGFRGELGLPLDFDRFPRIGVGPTFVIVDGLRLELPIFYQYDQHQKGHLFGVSMRSDVEIYRCAHNMPLSIFAGFSYGSMIPTDRLYTSFGIGVAINAPARF